MQENVASMKGGCRATPSLRRGVPQGARHRAPVPRCSAARVMAPTTDALLDFVGRAVSGMPLLDA
jgi:hypothetical protein